MKTITRLRALKTGLLRALAFALVIAAAFGSATAGPGAHGPDGQHLDGDGQIIGSSVSAPRMEAKSETFELVATLTSNELSILIDRFATNEPVLGATVEVESGTAKAKALFHADHGDYAVDDAAFLKTVSAPGEHALVITIAAGKESDLLDGVLKVGAHPQDDHQHTVPTAAMWIVGALLAFAVVTFIWRRRRNSSALRRAT